MPALITLSHGSRHPDSAEGVDRLTQAAGEALGVVALSAHLDFHTDVAPSLVTAAQCLVDAGHREAVVVPLLFTDAYHSRHDVPAAVAESHGATGLDLRLARGLGTGEDIAALLADRTDPHASHVTLAHVGSSDEDAERAVADLGGRIATRLGKEVAVVRATGRSAASISGATHLIPLFVTEALLLDKLRNAHPGVTFDAPLTAELAPIVAERYRVALT